MGCETLRVIACRSAAVVGALSLFAAAPAATGAEEKTGTPSAPAALQPKIQDLGNGQYRIGLVEVDKTKRSIRIPGAILREEPPLEFLAVTQGGFKDYESLLALGASAYEVNLACILVGLDPDRGKAPQFHFDPEPVVGDAVDVWVEWERKGKTTRVDAADLIMMGEKKLAPGEWVYTGSVITPDGQYLAHLDGTIIGFVHDPSPIIEHRTGLGLGAFGAVVADKKLLPPVGTRVTVIVEPRGEPKAAAAK
ncbi:MAG: YdjY domain-containing protein [Myxococcota bacterium]